MKTYTLKEEVRIGQSVYPIGTKVEGNPLYTDSRHECVWVTFPGGEGTHLRSEELEGVS